MLTNSLLAASCLVFAFAAPLTTGADAVLADGPALALKPAPVALTEGLAVKCADKPSNAVFRYTAKEIRHYPDPTIASSWDPVWRQFKNIDCTGIKVGTPMALNHAVLPEGASIACSNMKPSPVFRLVNNTIYRFRFAAYASSWDPKWHEFKTIDCTSLARGFPLALKPAPVALTEGLAVKCADKPSDAIFRYTANEIRLYPDHNIASSWDPVWPQFKNIDCTGIKVGTPMALNAVLTNGASIVCSNMMPVTVFLLVDDTIYGFPNPTIASSWDPKWIEFKTINCTSLARGPALALKPAPVALTEGLAVKCADKPSNAIFRYTANEIRLYPDHNIASSWDPVWPQFKNIDCTGIKVGTPMAMSKAVGAN